MARGKYRQQQWDHRESTIIEALERLATAHGFAQVTMDDVADEVGISKATLYQHFASKDAMLAHLFVGHYSRFIEWLEMSSGEAPLARLLATMRYLMAENVMAMRMVMAMGRETVLPVFRGAPELLAQRQQSQRILTAVIEQGQADGTITPDLHPQAVIHAMWSLSSIAYEAQQPSAATEALDPDMLAEQIVQMFGRSLCP